MKIIVICTGNTCRSQIAEGLLKSKYPEAEIYSAGTHPETQVNPYAVQAMAEVGYDISKQYPKLVNDFIHKEFDYVLTVCNSAQETCPVFPNAKNRIHNSFVTYLIKKDCVICWKFFGLPIEAKEPFPSHS